MARCMWQGLDFRDFLRTKILDPCGLSSFWVGCPEQLQPQQHFADVVSIPPTEGHAGPAEGRVDWNSPEIRALGLPAGGGWTTASDLALFYQPLLRGGVVFGVRQPSRTMMGSAACAPPIILRNARGDRGARS